MQTGHRYASFAVAIQISGNEILYARRLSAHPSGRGVSPACLTEAAAVSGRIQAISSWAAGHCRRNSESHLLFLAHETVLRSVRTRAAVGLSHTFLCQEAVLWGASSSTVQSAEFAILEPPAVLRQLPRLRLLQHQAV